jgi:Domain of unknown function (DUF4402)
VIAEFILKRSFLIVFPLMLPAPSFGASQPGTAHVVTIKPLGIVKMDDLDFGTMAPSAAAGTVSVNAQTGARTSAGGAILSGGTPAAAQFVIAATPLNIVTLSLNPNNNIVLNRLGGGASMTVNQFRVSYNGLLPVPLGPNQVVPLNGQLFMLLGGRLNIAANQMEGTYEGDFDVTVDYQ